MSIHPVIDGFEFAELGRTFTGSLRAADFPRLRDMLAAESGSLEWSVSGVRDAKGRPGLRLRIQGTLRLSCQRCLGIVEFPVQLDSTLVLARSIEGVDPAAIDADSPDIVLAGGEMQVLELLEDELLLSIPYAPRHDACGAENGRGAADAGRASPFARLRGLVHGKPSGKGIKRG